MYHHINRRVTAMILITAILSTLLAIADSVCIDIATLTEENVYLEDSLLRETPASSILECAAGCSSHSDCLSFGFEPETRSCHLHTQNGTTGSSELSVRMNWLHGDITKWSKVLLGPCSSYKCASSEKCIIHRITKVPSCVKAEVTIPSEHCPEPAAIPNANISSGHQREGSVRTYTCYHGYLDMSHVSVTATTTCLTNGTWRPVIFNCSEMVKCGKAPDVPEARKKTNGYFPGDVTTYTCNPDYTPCLNRTTSECQSTGEWEDVNGLCGQFRWHNPKQNRLFMEKENKHSLPCGPADQFMVAVLGKPTNTNRFSLNLWHGADALVHVDCRLKHSENNVVINSYLDDNWQRQTDLNKMPLTVGRNFNISIRLQDGTYKVFVDNSLIVNYSELLPGVNPEELTIWGSLCITLVEFTP